MSQFLHHDLRLHNPSFDSPLVDVLTELEHPRCLPLAETPTPNVADKISVKIFELLEKNPEMTLAEVGKTPRAIELASSKLVKTGRLRYVGPQKGGHWEVLK